MPLLKITKTAARAEIARRKLPKSDPARSVRPAPHIMRATTAELRAIAGAPARKRTPAPAPAYAATKPQATPVPDDTLGMFYIGTDCVGYITASEQLVWL